MHTANEVIRMVLKKEDSAINPGEDIKDLENEVSGLEEKIDELEARAAGGNTLQEQEVHEVCAWLKENTTVDEIHELANLVAIMHETDIPYPGYIKLTE